MNVARGKKSHEPIFIEQTFIAMSYALAPRRASIEIVKAMVNRMIVGHVFHYNAGDRLLDLFGEHSEKAIMGRAIGIAIVCVQKSASFEIFSERCRFLLREPKIPFTGHEQKWICVNLLKIVHTDNSLVPTFVCHFYVGIPPHIVQENVVKMRHHIPSILDGRRQSRELEPGKHERARVILDDRLRSDGSLPQLRIKRVAQKQHSDHRRRHKPK
jgi:hypothetical protein